MYRIIYSKYRTSYAKYRTTTIELSILNIELCMLNIELLSIELLNIELLSIELYITYSTCALQNYVPQDLGIWQTEFLGKLSQMTNFVHFWMFLMLTIYTL